MSSKRRTDSSRRNGAKSHGPSTPEGKARAAQNAMHHGLLANCVLLKSENAAVFNALFQQHIDHFQPADGVEIGIVEEMVAAKWRLHRTWALQTSLLETELAQIPVADNADRIATALTALAVSPTRAVLDRYETRFQLMYQRALRSLKLLRSMDGPHLDDLPNDDLPSEPSPISEHPAPEPQPPAQPPDSNEPGGPAKPGCSRPSGGLTSRPAGSSLTVPAVNPPLSTTPPRPKEYGAAV